MLIVGKTRVHPFSDCLAMGAFFVAYGEYALGMSIRVSFWFSPENLKWYSVCLDAAACCTALDLLASDVDTRKVIAVEVDTADVPDDVIRAFSLRITDVLDLYADLII